MIGAEPISLSMQAAALLVPPAVYFFLLGLLNSQPRPQLIGGRTDFVLLNAAFLPVFVLPVLSWLAVSAWTVSGAIAAVLAGAAMLAPRGAHWVVYNISLPEAVRAAERALQAMGRPFRREGRRLRLTDANLSLRVASVALLRNVSVSAEGDDARSFARLFREEDSYRLGVLTGTTVQKDRQAQSPTIQTRPLIFIDMNIDKTRFLETFGSNHILAVEGHLQPELDDLADLLGIRFVKYDLPSWS